MTYEQIAHLLNAISERFDWEKVMEGDNIIGLKQVICIFFVTISIKCLYLNFGLIRHRWCNLLMHMHL